MRKSRTGAEIKARIAELEYENQKLRTQFSVDSINMVEKYGNADGLEAPIIDESEINKLKDKLEKEYGEKN